MNTQSDVGSYKNAHSDVVVFASNIAQTKGGKATPSFSPPVFLPADPDPVLVPFPVFNAGAPNPKQQPPQPPSGSGGNSSWTHVGPGMTRANPNTAPVGIRFVVEAVDAPATGFVADHITDLDLGNAVYVVDLNSPLIEIQYNLTFTGYLLLWSSATGVPDWSNTPPPNGSLAERTYAVILQQPWSITSDFTIDATGHGTGAGWVTVDPTAAASFLTPFAVTGGVFTPPRAGDVAADNVKK